MARAHYVKRAAKDNPVAHKGQPYWWWRQYRSPKNYSATPPTAGQLDGRMVADAILAGEALEQFIDDWSRIGRPLDEDQTSRCDELEAALEECKDQVEECQDSYTNAADESPQQEAMEEMANALEEWASDLENVDTCTLDSDDWRGDYLEGQEDGKNEESTAEAWTKALEDHYETMADAAREACNGFSDPG